MVSKYVGFVQNNYLNLPEYLFLYEINEYIEMTIVCNVLTMGKTCFTRNCVKVTFYMCCIRRLFCFLVCVCDFSFHLSIFR